MIKTPFISVKGKLLWLVIWLKEAVWIGRIFLEWDMYIIYIYIYFIYRGREREREILQYLKRPWKIPIPIYKLLHHYIFYTKLN
jgi:hypothetical protein